MKNSTNVDLLNGIAHNLRTPLTNMSLVGQTIGDESIPNEKKDYRRLSAMIADESKRMSRQVDNIMQLFEDKQGFDNGALPDSIKKGETPETTLLNQTAIDEKIEALTEPKYKQVQIDLSVEVADPVPVLKYGEHVIFREVIYRPLEERQRAAKRSLSCFLRANIWEAAKVMF